MTGSLWWDLLIGLAVALLVAWLALVIVLVAVRPRGGLLGESLRLLPDVLRLVLLVAWLDAVRTHWPGTDDGFAALVRVTGMAR